MSLKRIAIAILVAALSLSCGIANAQKLTRHVGEVEDGYNFWLYNPDSNNSIKEHSEEEKAAEFEAKPVIIFLHGASLCGRDLNKVKKYGTINAIERGYKPDAYVIAPQNPGGAWNPDKIVNIFDYVAEHHNVDYDRVYALGMSLGGYGTIDLAARYPDLIAAAMAFCGGGTERDLSGLNQLPLWIVHGTADRAVSVNQSDRVVAAMNSLAGGKAPRLIYDRIHGMDHSTPARLFYLPETYNWLLSHSLQDDGRKPAEAFTINSSLLKNVYRRNSSKKNYQPKSKSKTKSRSKKKRK